MKPLARLFPAFATFAFAVTTFGQTFDYADDFSIAGANPNGAWSYGYSATLGGAMTNHTTSQTIGDEIFWRSNVESSTLPAHWKNTGVFTGTGGLAAGAAAIHPGPGAGEFGIARLSTPSAGTVTIDGSFGEGDFGIVSVYVLKNGTPLFSVTNTGATQSFSLSTSLLATDTLDFVVGSSGIINGDTTPLDATVVLTPVPEPATMAALGLGALAMLRRRRR